MSPFVASHASLSAPCLQTLSEFERTLNFDDCKRNENPQMSVDDFVVDSLLSFDSSLSSRGDLFQETFYESNPVWFMPFLMPTSNCSHQDHSDVCWWLIDSGASASVVSSRFLSEYEVLHQVSLPTNRVEGFSSASGEVIVPTSVVCIRAFFRMNSIENPRKEELKECLIAAFVADVPNNVVSVGTLLKKGWCLGNNGAFMEITKDGFRLQITTWHNVPWMYHEKCGIVKCRSDVAAPPCWSKTQSRESRSKERASSSKHVHFGGTHTQMFEGSSEPFLIAMKRKAEDELPIELSPETVYRSQPQADPSPDSRTAVGVPETAEQSGAPASSSASGARRIDVDHDQIVVDEPNPSLGKHVELEPFDSTLSSGLRSGPPEDTSVLKSQGADSVAHPSVEPSEEQSSSKHPVVLKKNQRVRQSLEEHRSQGHFPFHADCLSCSSAKSVTQRRRRNKDKIYSEISAGFFFIETYKFLILVDMSTGMKGFVPISPVIKTNQAWLRNWLHEFNLLGESRFPLEILTDAEESVSQLFLGLDIGRDYAVIKSAPQAHQTNGHAEGAIRILKDAIAALRQDLRNHNMDLNLADRKGLNAALAYICHCSNIHSTYLDTKQSPKEIALGRSFQLQTALFGSTVLAEVPDSLKDSAISRFERAAYIRPEFNSLGHVCCCVLAGVERIFVARSIKVLTPITFEVRLAPSFLMSYDRSLTRKSLEDEHQKMDIEKAGEDISMSDRALPSEPQVFVKTPNYERVRNVPTSWIREHGITESCNVCKRKSFHGRQHSKACVARYVKWLKEQDAKQAMHESSTKSSGLHPSDVKAPSVIADPSVPMRLTSKQPRPPSLPEPSVPLNERFEPHVPAPVSLPIEVKGGIDVEGGLNLRDSDDLEYTPTNPPSPIDRDEGLHDASPKGGDLIVSSDVPTVDVEMASPPGDMPMPAISAADFADLSVPASLTVDPDAMQLGSLVTALNPFELDHLETRHIGLMQSVYQIKGQETYSEEVTLCDQKVKLIYPGYVLSDADGRYLSCELSWEGMKTETSSMTSQKVGRLLDEKLAKELCRLWNISPITTRWVCVEKDPTNVRMRLVAREIAKGQLSARDLMVSSPTSSIESLRLMLSEASANDLVILGLDVSAAFMASPLGQKLGKPIKVILRMPSNITFPDGSPVFMEAYKAISGLRSSGLAWVEHLANLLQSLKISPSPLESTIFAGEVTIRKGQKPEWIQVVAYVDDLLVFAKSEEAAMFVFDYLSKSLKVKKTGLIKTSKAGGGSLRFLGRTIERKPKQSRITVRLDSTYLDSTFEAFQIARGTDTPPDLRPILDEEKPEKNECLTAEAVTRYRAALGKLGWMTQTFLHLSIYYSLLATGMSEPLMKHEHALRSLLRWLYNHRNFVQHFPAPEFSFGQDHPSGSKIVIYSDASWAPLRSFKRRSISGMAAFHKGSLVKAFSRIQSIVATSSCEAELSAIAECVQESVGLNRLAEHLSTQAQVESLMDSVCSAVGFNQLFIHLFGLSKDEPIAPVEIRTDSQAAIRVLQASGLQRRSRHVELRICFCQDLVKKGLVKMIWVDGKFQVADILTKTLGIKLFNQFRVSMGFLEEEETDPAVLEIAVSSSSSRKKLAPMLHAKQSVMSHKADPSTGKSRSCPSMLVEASSIAEIKQQFEVVIIEICCSSESALAATALQVFPLNSLIVRCTKTSPLEENHQSILELLKRHHERPKKFSFVQFSLPCTGGSSLMHLCTNEELKSGYKSQFFHLLNLCFGIRAECTVWCFELPKRNSYWKSSQVRRFIQYGQEHVFANMPKLCVCGGPQVGKTFLFATNHRAIAQCLQKFISCEHASHLSFNTSRWTSTGRYPALLVFELLTAIKTVALGEVTRRDGGYIMFDPQVDGETFLYTSKRLFERPIE